MSIINFVICAGLGIAVLSGIKDFICGSDDSLYGYYEGRSDD